MTNEEIRAKTEEPWRSMIPNPHPPRNCGPLDMPILPGRRCPTCGIDPAEEEST